MHDLVSVIVATCGKNEYYVSCLQSISQQSYPFFEVILIDNSFIPSLSPRAVELCPSLKVYSSPRNLFYCESMNQGIGMSSGKFILCLNDDVILEKDFIKEALLGFEADPDIGMVGGKILRQDRKTLDSAGLSLSIWRTAQDRGYGKPDRGQFETAEFVFGLCGAAVFCRRDMLADIKEGADYFDSSFRIFYEDLDISWRARNRGWKARYVPKAIAYHVRGGSIRLVDGPGKAFARQYLCDDVHAGLIKNRYQAIIKNETFFGAFFCFIPIVLHDLSAWSYIIFFRPRVLVVFFSDFKWFKEAMNKRAMKGRFFRASALSARSLP